MPSAFGGNESEAFRALHAVTKRLHASLDLTETLDAVARGIVTSTGFRVAALSLFRPEGHFEVVSVEGDADCRDTLLGTRLTLEMWDRIEACAESRGDAIFFIDSRRARNWTDGITVHRLDLPSGDDPDAWQPDDALFVVLTSPSRRCIGLLSVDDPIDGRHPSEHQLELLALFGDHAVLAIEHAHMHSMLQQRQDELHHAATHDPLTGLANRALLNVDGARMAALGNAQLAIIVIDLDDFKKVNDTAGHASGDEVLIILAERMRRCVRKGDILARIGGDEFVIVVTGDAIEGLVETLVERIKRIASEPVQTSRGTHYVGASVGAAISATPCDFLKTLSQADAQMYDCKRTKNIRGSRQNRIAAADPYIAAAARLA